MEKKQKKPLLRQKINRRIHRHFHKHIDKAIHVADLFHYHVFHTLELAIIVLVTVFSGSILFANLTGVSEIFYRNNDAEVAQELLKAMQNSTASLKQGNIISVWNMDTEVENSFAKGYCTYGAARISPEFFPFIDEKIQQRTRGGNAVDRCKNAFDTGYKIGSTPRQGALVVYDAGGRFGNYGHVGKVLHYSSSLNKIIVRDMARVARSTMSDRWENLSTANIKCYIYNSKTDIQTDTKTEINGISPNTPQTNTSTPLPPNNNNNNNNAHGSSQGSTTTPIEKPIEKPLAPTNTNGSQTNQTPITPPTQTIIPVAPSTPTPPAQTNSYKQLLLNLDHVSDIAEHFFTQNTIIITVNNKKPFIINNSTYITLTITNKKTGEKYSGLIPFNLSLLTSNDAIQTDIANIKIIRDGSIDVSVIAKKAGASTIIVTIDDQKITEIPFIIQ